MIVYDRLWETMKRKNISQYYLIHYCKVSTGQMDRLRKNEYISTHTVDMLCSLLGCKVEDIMEYQADLLEADKQTGNPLPGQKTADKDKRNSGL